MSCGGEKIRHENDRLTLVGQNGTHLGVSMAIDDKDIEAQRCAYAVLAYRRVDKFQLPAFLQGQDVFRQEAGAFSGVGFGGPIPMALVSPVIGVFEGRFVACAFGIPLHSAPHMIKVKMGQEHIGDIVAIKTVNGQ